MSQPFAPVVAEVSPMLYVGGGALLLAALVFAFIWWRHRSTKQRVTARFEAFKDSVIQMRQRVEATRERHRLLTASVKDYTQPMQGTTLAVYTQVEGEVTRLWEGWLQRMDAWERAGTLIASEGFLRIRRLREAEQLLDQIGQFEEVEQSIQGCVEHLDRLEKGHETARTLHAEQQQRPEPLRAQIASVGNLKLNTTPFDEALAKCVALIAEGQTLTAADPLGGLAALEEARDRMDALEKLIKDVIGLFEKSGKARTDLEEAANRVAACRSRGLRLIEAEGNPDPLLERGRAEHAKALEALQQAEAKTARKHLDAAFDQMKQVGEVIERQEKAKAECARELPARRTTSQRLRHETATAQSHRTELERDFAPESWRTVADNVDRSRQLQSAADSGTEEAATTSSDAVQHYFRAVSLLEQVRKQQEQAQQLLPLIEQRLRELTAVRQECLQRRQELNDLARQAQSYFATHASAVGRTARAHLDTAEERWRQVRTQTDSARPNWPVVKQQLDEARQGYATARKQAEEDVAAHGKLLARFDELRREATRIERGLEGRHEVRARAGTAHRTARQTLERIDSESRRGPADWAALLKQLEEAAEGLRQAEASAREDIRLAEQAHGEISGATQALGRAGDFFTSGRPPEMSHAESLFSEAARHVAEQEYEKAIEKAAAARRTVERAIEEATRRAAEEQQRAEQERQRIAAETASTPSAPAPLWSESALMSRQPEENPPASPNTEPGQQL